MKTFEEYVLDWWGDYVDASTEKDRRFMMEALIGEEESIDDYIPEDAESVEEWLKTYDDADVVYQAFLYDSPKEFDNPPDLEGFIYHMFRQACDCNYSFTSGFIHDMVYHASGYVNPAGFFEDLQHGGCVSGMIGMLIYNSDCKDLYVANIDDMEEFVETLESEFGGHIKLDAPRYTSVCWLCYEETAYRIGRNLFPQIF